MGIARPTYYDKPKGSADDTAPVGTMHAIKDEFEAYGWCRMQAAVVAGRRGSRRVSTRQKAKTGDTDK